MSDGDFIPSSDPEFNIWQGNLILLVEPNLAIWGIPVNDMDALKA